MSDMVSSSEIFGVARQQPSTIIDAAPPPSTTPPLGPAGAATTARPSQELSIRDLLIKFNLTVEVVRDISPDVLSERLRALAAAMTGADRLRRALVVAELKKTVKVPMTIIHAALNVRETEPDTPATHTIMLSDDEPWPEPVDGATLLNETVATVLRYVVLSPAQADAIVLWVGASHAIDVLQLMPMLLISSPTPECGKSTTSTVIGAMVPRAITVSSLTPATLFRVVNKYRPTLIGDEADSWLNDEQSELRGIFNAAHWRAGAVIPRCVGDTHEVELFNVFGAKVVVMIGRPKPTMLSRSIVVTLRRKTSRERVEPLRVDRLCDDLAPLRQRWRRWTLDHSEALRDHEPAMPPDLPVNRASDNWRPLLAFADLVGGLWPIRARAAATALSGVRVSEDEPDAVALLADMQVAFRERGEPEYLSSEEIIVALKALSESQWADWNKGRGITAAQLASHLRGFGTGPHGLRTRETRIGHKTGKRWHRADFLDAWGRYVTAEPQHPQQANDSGPQPAISSPQQSTDVAAPKLPVQPMFTGLVAGVAALRPDLEGTPENGEHDDRPDSDMAWRDQEEREDGWQDL